jgi:proline racemase
MSESLSCSWSGVFPAATTQFDPALQVDLPATVITGSAHVTGENLLRLDPSDPFCWGIRA